MQRDAALLREHSYLGHAQLRALGGVGEMFDTLLVYENFPTGGLAAGGELTAAGATFRPAALESLSHFPITLAAHMDGGELVVLIEVIDGALGATTAATLGRRVLATAERLLQRWDRPLREVSVLLDDEAAPLRAAGAITPAAPRGIHTRFAEIAADDAGQPRGQLGGRHAELPRAGRLGQPAGRRARRPRGAGAETPVAIRLSRGPQYIVAMLAVLKAGAMCVPLEPGMPPERVDSILRQSGATIVVDEELLKASDHQGSDFRPVDVAPEQAAYVVFTSGTTGEPKGVIGTHAAVGAYADDHLDNVLRPAAARLGRPLRIAHAWSFAFDAAWQPLVALLDGHAVHVVDEHTQTDAEALVADHRRARYRHDRHHPFDVCPAEGVWFADDECRWRCWRWAAKPLGSTSWALIRNECARTRDDGLQLLRPHRDHGRGGGGRHRRARRAVDRAADPAHPRLRAGLRVARRAVRSDRRAVSGRRAAGPRLSGPRGGDQSALRCRPVRRWRAHVPHRRSGAAQPGRRIAIRRARR